MHFSETFTKLPSQSTFANPAGAKLVDLCGWYSSLVALVLMFLAAPSGETLSDTCSLASCSLLASLSWLGCSHRECLVTAQGMGIS